MSQVMSITPEQLQEILRTVVAESKRLNPIEQKEFDEKMKAEKRRLEMVKTMGQIEEQAQRNKRNGCSHMRYPATAGKLSGMSAPRGGLGAEWTTGGQAYQDGTAVIICTRCSTTWRFRPSADYYAVILQNGLGGSPPPPQEETICEGCFMLRAHCDCAEKVEKQMESVASA